MRLVSFVFFLGCLFLCFSVANGEEVQESVQSILKIRVFQTGQLEVAGEVSDLAQLDRRLKGLKEKKGTVWYYRENGQEKPPQVAMQVIELVIASKNPIVLSSKPDFSDIVDDQGKSKPKK
jgi:hypothetical protein